MRIKTLLAAGLLFAALSAPVTTLADGNMETPPLAPASSAPPAPASSPAAPDGKMETPPEVVVIEAAQDVAQLIFALV